MRRWWRPGRAAGRVLQLPRHGVSLQYIRPCRRHIAVATCDSPFPCPPIAGRGQHFCSGLSVRCCLLPGCVCGQIRAMRERRGLLFERGRPCTHRFLYHACQRVRLVGQAATNSGGDKEGRQRRPMQGDTGQWRRRMQATTVNSGRHGTQRR